MTREYEMIGISNQKKWNAKTSGKYSLEKTFFNLEFRIAVFKPRRETLFF